MSTCICVSQVSSHKQNTCSQSGCIQDLTQVVGHQTMAGIKCIFSFVWLSKTWTAAIISSCLMLTPSYATVSVWDHIQDFTMTSNKLWQGTLSDWPLQWIKMSALGVASWGLYDFFPSTLTWACCSHLSVKPKRVSLVRATISSPCSQNNKFLATQGTHMHTTQTQALFLITV